MHLLPLLHVAELICPVMLDQRCSIYEPALFLSMALKSDQTAARPQNDGRSQLSDCVMRNAHAMLLPIVRPVVESESFSTLSAALLTE